VTNQGLIQEGALSLKRLLYEQASENQGWREMQVAWCGMLLVKILRGGGDSGNVKSIDRVRWYAEEMATSFYLNEGIDDVAARLGLSRRRFTQLFREVTGEAWLQRLRSLRIEHACRLLRETGRSTKAIAFECGFDSLPQFYRTFRQRTGMTPGDWRRG
jgi:AraC-like DNA-binding protein